MTVPSEISPHLFLDDTPSEAELKASKLCCAAMISLRYMAERQEIGLTKSGAFNRNFVVWAVDEFNWPPYTAEQLYVVNKVLNEDDVPPLFYLHALLRADRLIRHVKGKARLTKKGRALVGDHGGLQAALFETFFTKFDFAAFERWPIEMPDADTAHFLGVIQNRLTDWVPYPEFAGWCLPIFALPAQRGAPEEDAMFYLHTRLVRPLSWLGLLEEKEASRLAPIHSVQLRKPPLFDRFLRFEFRGDASRTVH
jgi:hypothetical protein